MWKALVLVVKSTTSLGRPYYPPGSAIYFDFSLSRCCITLFWGFLSNKNLVFTSCGRLFHHIFKIFLLKYGDFLLVYHNLILKLRLIASQRSNRHHLKMRCPNGGPFLSLNFSKKDSIFFLLPACWHNENHHLHGDFQVKKEIQCNSGAYTWP